MKWLKWIIARILDIFFTLLKYTLVAGVMLALFLFAITYLYHLDSKPCWERPFMWDSAVIKMKLHDPADNSARLSLVEFKLTLDGEQKRFRAWLTPKQVAQVKRTEYPNLRIMKDGGYIISDWQVTIEDS